MFHSRAEFRAAASLVKDDYTRAQVRAILGPPDDIWPSTDSHRYINLEGGEVWAYGTNGHHTFPTLGSITFRHGKVLIGGPWGSPPSPTVISESELRTAMRAIHRFSDGNYWWTDSLRMIQVVNALQPLGKGKALAAIVEYTRVVPLWREGDSNFPFWLVRHLFHGKKGDYVFPVPHVGALQPEPPKDPSTWPTYPVVLLDGLPVNLLRGLTLAGYPEPFDRYAEAHGKDWKMRSDLLRPPDDPFYLIHVAASHPRFKSAEDRTSLAKTIIRTVRTVYQEAEPSWMRGDAINAKGWEAFHRKFLELGGHWDEGLQMYVRRDGSFDPDRVGDP